MCHRKHDHENQELGLKLLYKAVVSLQNIEETLGDLHEHLMYLLEEDEDEHEEEHEEDEDECHCHEEDED